MTGSTTHPHSSPAGVGKARRYLVTAALPYPNNRLHIGHIAGAYLPSDTYVRFLRSMGRDVLFVCGSDDHGVATVIASEKLGLTPAEAVAKFGGKQAEDFASIGISFDVYGSTSRNPFHRELSQQFFLKLYEQGLFEKQRTDQFYDESKQMFLPDRYVKGRCGYCGALDQNGDQCEECGKLLDTTTLLDATSVPSGTPASIRSTAHWFIDLSHFEGKVKEWIKGADLRPHSRNFLDGLMASGGMVKRAMTRDISWGIPVPLDDPEARGKVLYVWFDAPIGYISNTMQILETLRDRGTFEEWWKTPDTDIIHFIGEDNTIFHCVIWIAMLAAQGDYSLPRTVVVNTYLNFELESGEVAKMSKSRGTAVFIEDFVKEGGAPDTLRYYLTAIAPESGRTSFNPEHLAQRHNTDLANTLGNFVHRVLSFSRKNYGTNVPERFEHKVTPEDTAFMAARDAAYKRTTEILEGRHFKAALETLMEFAREGNRYIDTKAPWTTRKTDAELTQTTLWHAIQAIKLLSITLEPFIPFSMARLQKVLGLEGESARWSNALAPLAAGTPLGEPEILFQKIETAAEVA